MSFINSRCLCILSIIGLSIFSQSSFALPNDREQPINISANQAHKNSKQGVTVYKGNVIMTQGSINITADKVTIHDNNGEVDKIVATGTPATFKQQPKPESGLVTAQALTLEYELKKESLVLLNEALLKQEGKTTRSNKITYDIKTAVMNAGDDTGRVQMIIKTTQK
ncbi:lipopolysaccharide transport periplasmic protein LptA [Candidatus Endobugula sertula]|uniref:Lipopolysaccharide export system protein LptA n=1 Tax=Candidatus Endobugula sertula TaxID=62101 RepID=A0A1D2QQN9_9GAMM|nr:lipopolysaccharide transport periplasmic protein LptA [Candidatus Endobugula sertula]